LTHASAAVGGARTTMEDRSMLHIPDGEMGHLIVFLLPFTRSEVMDGFARYNAAYWPVEVGAFALGIAITVLQIRNSAAFMRTACWGLAVMWIWTGITYFWIEFANISRAGRFLTPFFVVQGLLLFKVGLSGGKLRQQCRFDWPTTLGAVIIGFALLVYPLIGLFAGFGFARLPMFGVTPASLTLFTLGVFLMADRVFPRALWVLPLLWTIVGGAAALVFGLPQDLALLASAVLAVTAIWKRLPDEQLA
jgi:Family of unknown function (DUF6064)